MPIEKNPDIIKLNERKQSNKGQDDLPEINVFGWKEAEGMILENDGLSKGGDFKSRAYKNEYHKAMADGKIVKTEEELLEDLEALLQLSREEAQTLRKEVELNENYNAREFLNSKRSSSHTEKPYFSPQGFIPDYVELNSSFFEPMLEGLEKNIEDALLQSEQVFVQQNWMNQENIDEITWLSLYDRGLEFFRSGLYEQSLYYYEKALALEPNSFKLWASKGMALFWLNDSKAAIKCINKSLKLNPRYYRAWSNKGLVFKQKGRFADAMKCFSKALKHNPEFANGWFEKAQISQSMGKYNQAIKYYNKVLKMQAGNRAALFYRNECKKIVGYAK